MGVRFVVAQKLLHLADKVVLRRVNLDTHHPGTLAGEQLEADGPRTGKEVECLDALEVDEVFQYVEEILPGKVGRRPGLDMGGDIEPPTPVFTADDSHKNLLVSI